MVDLKELKSKVGEAIVILDGIYATIPDEFTTTKPQAVKPETSETGKTQKPERVSKRDFSPADTSPASKELQNEIYDTAKELALNSKDLFKIVNEDLGLKYPVKTLKGLQTWIAQKLLEHLKELLKEGRGQ